MDYRIVEKEAFKIAGVKREVEMKDGEVSIGYGDIISAIDEAMMDELETLSDGEPSGVVYVTANYEEQSDGKATFDHYFGALTNKEAETQFSSLEVPAMAWAVFEVEGKWEVVDKQWQQIYAEWLPSTSYELAKGPEMLASKDQTSEIWIPVEGARGDARL